MRRSGVLLPVTSLPSRFGIGTFSKEAYAFVDFLKEAGQKLWQILPLGPTGYGDSPYQAFSTFAGNPYLIDPDQLVAAGWLTQEELADRAELSKGFISQLENDVTSPSIATLVDVLTCLGTDLKTFFGEEQDNQVVFCEEDYFVKTAEAQGNEIAWIVPNAQKNRMEPIRLTLQSGACTEIDSPHEGEEFGYVLSGRILLHLGDECHKVKKGESFYYPASCNHYLENPGKTPAIILWVSSPPYF